MAGAPLSGLLPYLINQLPSFVRRDKRENTIFIVKKQKAYQLLSCPLLIGFSVYRLFYISFIAVSYGDKFWVTSPSAVKVYDATPVTLVVPSVFRPVK